MTTSSKFFVYLLLCSDNSTYIGATVDLNHRLRQHNCEIKGGAVATSRKVKKGEFWKRVCYVSRPLDAFKCSEKADIRRVCSALALSYDNRILSIYQHRPPRLRGLRTKNSRTSKRKGGRRRGKNL